MLGYFARGKMRIRFALARELALPRSLHTCTDDRARFPARTTRELIRRNRRHFDVNVDPIEQRSRDASAVTSHLFGRAMAFARVVTEIPARARIHRGNQGKARWKRNAERRARDGDATVLQWLTQRLERAAWKLQQLVEEQDAVMREANFARAWDAAAPDQSCRRNGMVGRTEWARGEAEATD